MSKGVNAATGTRTAVPAPAGAEAVQPANVRSGPPCHVRIVVVGEFNSGKTALVNALVGAPVLTPSSIVHTAHPTVIRYAAKPSLTAETANRKRKPMAWNRIPDLAPDDICRVHVGAPLECLRQFSVVDTPGLGFADSESDRRSLQACRGADVVIWCTPAMQAWKASEEKAWLALPKAVRARGVLAVTFADEIVPLSDVDRLLERLRTEAGPYFRMVVVAGDCAAVALNVSASGGVRRPGRRPVARPAATGAASTQPR